MADISGLGGSTRGNEQEATNLLKSQGIQNPSSGLVRYVAYGATDYGYGEATQYGLPISSGMLEGERQRAIAPALESYRASKPEVGQAFDVRTGQLQAEKDPLKERYANLLAELTGRETKETAAQGKYLSQEYGKRGIPLSSGVYQQDLTGKTQDISQYYGVQRKDVGLGQEADLRDLSNQISNLTTQRVAAMRDIDNKIAELQAGAGNQAVTDALTMYREDLNRKFESRFDDLDRQIKEKQLQGETDLYSRYATIGEGQTVFDLQTLQSIFKNPKTYKAGDGEDDWE